MRTTTLEGRLARMGFSDAPAAERLITSDLALNIGPPEPASVQASFGGPPMDDALLEAIAAAADPDLALLGLARIAGTDRGSDAADIRAALRAEPAFRQRLTAVLGVSAGLADHLARHPDDCHLLRGANAVRRPSPGQLRAALLYAVGASPLDDNPVADLASLDGTDPAAALCVAYKRHILHLVARDITGVAATEEVASELADIAAAVLCAALAVSRAELQAGAAPCRITVLAMGKCGGCELNYASDVDVIFVAAPAGDGPGAPAGADPGAGQDVDAALRTATKLATGLIAVCSRTTPEGMIFPIDPNLRPEGRNGALVRTPASHASYYKRWAQTWEFQALLKARPAAGRSRRSAGSSSRSPRRGSGTRPGGSRSSTTCRPCGAASRRTSRGTCGAGNSNSAPAGCATSSSRCSCCSSCTAAPTRTLRLPGTLMGLRSLIRGGYVGRTDGAEMAAAYTFLRRAEHRLQLQRAAPDPPAARGPVRPGMAGRAMRTTGYPGAPAAPAPRRRWAVHRRTRVRHGATVRARLHEKLFYRPLLHAVARLPATTSCGCPRRLPAPGWPRSASPSPTRRCGTSRRSPSGCPGARPSSGPCCRCCWTISPPARTRTPGCCPTARSPRRWADTPWYLRLLRDEASVAQRLATLLGGSRLIAATC